MNKFKCIEQFFLSYRVHQIAQLKGPLIVPLFSTKNVRTLLKRLIINCVHARNSKSIKSSKPIFLDPTHLLIVWLSVRTESKLLISWGCYVQLDPNVTNWICPKYYCEIHCFGEELEPKYTSTIVRHLTVIWVPRYIHVNLSFFIGFYLIRRIDLLWPFMLAAKVWAYLL